MRQRDRVTVEQEGKEERKCEEKVGMIKKELERCILI